MLGFNGRSGDVLRSVDFVSGPFKFILGFFKCRMKFLAPSDFKSNSLLYHMMASCLCNCRV